MDSVWQWVKSTKIFILYINVQQKVYVVEERVNN